MSNQLSRKEDMDAFIAAMDSEQYAIILDYAGMLISKGYVLTLTYDQLVDKLIEVEYDKIKLGLIKDMKKSLDRT